METPQSTELSPSLLEPLVNVVATLGELAATVAGPHGDVGLAVPPESLQKGLGTFISHLRDTLGHRGDTPLGQALAALGATPGATWAQVAAAATAWRESVAALGDSWARLLTEATELCVACRDVAAAEATAAATAGDLKDKVTHWDTARDKLVATVRQLPVALGKALDKALDKEEVASAVAAHEARVAAATDEVVAATKALEEATVATSQARAAAARSQRAEAALKPLGLLVAACAKATAFPWELLRRLGAIEAALEGLRGANEAAPDVPQALVAAVAEAERLWEASARLATRRLLGTLGAIRLRLVSGSGGPGGRSVAEQCQEAIEDIPRLLRGQ